MILCGTLEWLPSVSYLYLLNEVEEPQGRVKVNHGALTREIAIVV